MVIAVVGRGMIGSAAARHLAKAGQDVILVGTSEPADKAKHDGVFASHYDEGRITRSLDPYPFWSRVSRESIARYGQIEAESGVPFFHEVGLIMAGTEGTQPIANVGAGAERDGIACEPYRGAALAERFPYFQFAPETLALFEPTGAGHINPRALVRAQGIAAQKAGALVAEALVTGLQESSAGVVLQTSVGEIAADQVLICAGGFTNALLGERLDLLVNGRTVVLLEVDEAEQLRLAQMPPLIWLGTGGEDPYLLPPIRYPDGKVYLKMGGDPADNPLETLSEQQAWFRKGGDKAVADMLEEMVRARMPGLRVVSRRMDACVTTYTPNNIAALRRMSDRICVATAGCGRGAKCSDELGRLGAEVVMGRELPDWAMETAI